MLGRRKAGGGPKPGKKHDSDAFKKPIQNDFLSIPWKEWRAAQSSQTVQDIFTNAWRVAGKVLIGVLLVPELH